MFTYKDANEMKNTAVNRFYATTYENWKDDAVSIYNEVNEALAPVSGAAIVDHQILGDGVRAVTYSNGVTITINKSNKEVSVNGVKIPAKSYVTGGAE